MFHPGWLRSHKSFLMALLLLVLFAASSATHGQTPSTPSDVVREFYKALREHRFKEAWSLTIYKPAVQDLTAEEMEDLRTEFEDRAAKVPDQIEITGEEIKGNI